ncbi:MAG: fibronectin type III domain-containing protein [Acidimicrobiales bacterium]
MLARNLERIGLTPRRRQGILAGLLIVIGTMVAVPALAEINPQGEITWGVYGLDTTTETDRIQSQVWAIEQIGNRIYVGGKFTEARPWANGAPVAQPYLAAFDATTGDLITDFQPSLEGPVYTLEATPDGSRLLVGGEFRSINGDTEARGLAALDPATGAVDTGWRAKASNGDGSRPVVKNMSIVGDQVYVVGRFDRVGGGPRPLHLSDDLARISLADGTPDPSLSITVTGGSLWGVAVDQNVGKMFVVGYQDSINGDVRGADIAVLDLAGNLNGPQSNIPGNTPSTSNRYGQDVVTVNGLVFVAGSEHVMRVFRAADMSLVTQHSTDRGGDYQDLEVVGDRVYGSCHCYTNHYADFDYWPNRSTVIDPNQVQITPIKYLAAYSAVTGEYIPTFGVDASATRAGVWAIHGDSNGCLWIGGDISRYTTIAGQDRAAGAFAKFCPGGGGDTIAPEAPTNLTQTRAEDYRIVIRWDSSVDNLGVTGYTIYRDGVEVGTKAPGGAQNWFTDSNLEPGTTYTYSVVAADQAGNVSAPATLDAATTGGTANDTDPPAVPGNLTQTRSEDYKLVIRWDASTDNTAVASYTVYRDGVEIGTKPHGSSAQYWFTDSGLDVATAYQYEVVAVDTAGNVSAPATLTAGTTGWDTVATDPAAPTGLRSTTQTRERIVLNWEASAGAVEYVIAHDDGTGMVEVGTKTNLWFSDLNLPADTTFTYHVFAVDAAGTRSAPAELVVATLP